MDCINSKFSLQLQTIKMTTFTSLLLYLHLLLNLLLFKGLISAYKESVPKLKFAGPSVFSPVIERVFESVRSEAVTQENQHYTVLLIITVSVSYSSA